ncbi:MAG: type II toxin-antitoxin system Phd/YefM family antitoxin [Thermomicrobiales bacterium]
MPDAHAGHIGNSVHRTDRKAPRRDTQLPCPLPSFSHRSCSPVRPARASYSWIGAPDILREGSFSGGIHHGNQTAPPSTARTISTSNPKTSLNAIVNDVVTGEDIILERDGTPTAAVISMDDYRALQAMREKNRRAEALKRFEELVQQISAQKDDLTEDEAMDLAVRATREVRAEHYLDAEQRRAKMSPATDHP